MGFLNFVKSLTGTNVPEKIKIDPIVEADSICKKGRMLYESSNSVEGLSSIMELFEKAISLNPVLYEAWQGKGEVLEKMKRETEALEVYDLAISIDQNRDDCWLLKGRLLVRLKRYDDAMTCFDYICEHYNRQTPNYWKALLCKAITLEKASRPREAVASYDKLLSVFPMDPEELRKNFSSCKIKPLEIYERKARALKKIGQSDELDTCLAIITKIKEDEIAREEQLAIKRRINWIGGGISKHLTEAIEHERKGEDDIAKRLYQYANANCREVLSIDPDNTKALLKLAYIMIRWHRYDEAIKACNQVLEKYPDNKEAHELRERAKNKEQDPALGRDDPALRRENPARDALLKSSHSSMFKRGQGIISINNGSGYKASVIITEAGKRNIMYRNPISSGEMINILGITDGQYDLYFAFLDDKDIIARKKFENPLLFSTVHTSSGISYSRYDMTLHPVPGGKATTIDVSEREFPI